MRKRVVLTTLVFTVAVAAAATVGVGRADALLGLGGTCSGSTTKPFTTWNDWNSYYAAPNGGVESGSTGWSLSGGASIVSGNEPFLATGTHSLSLPSGSQAVSPTVCIGSNDPVLRMFVSDSGGTDSGLRVRVYWYGLLNTLLGISDYATFVPGTTWGPSLTVPTTGGINVLIPLLGSTSARIVLTPLGSGSAWHADDLYIDPLASRCC